MDERGWLQFFHAAGDHRVADLGRQPQFLHAVIAFFGVEAVAPEQGQAIARARPMRDAMICLPCAFRSKPSKSSSRADDIRRTCRIEARGWNWDSNWDGSFGCLFLPDSISS
jgi:hypothetical protein